MYASTIASSWGRADNCPLTTHATVEVHTSRANVSVNLVEGAIIAAEEPGPPETLASLGEFGLIEALSAWLPPGPGTLVGIGDDAAVLRAPDGRVVATTDFLLE